MSLLEILSKKKKEFFSFFLISIIFLNVVFLFNSRYHKKASTSNNNFNEELNINGPLTPKGIRLTANDNSSNSIVITWYTEASATEPRVNYSLNSNLEESQIKIPSSKNIGNTYIYTAELSDLVVNRTYYYKISSDSSNEREIFNFTTSVDRYSDNIKFLIYGDSRTQREERQELINKIIEKFNDLDFTIHVGDMVEDGRVQSQWNDYFQDIEPLNRKVLGYFIEGNHEHTDGYMYDNIILPSNGLNSRYYSFNIGPVSFLGLNSYQDTGIQASWIESKLNNSIRDNNTLWKIGYMHEPIFNSRYDRQDRTDLIASWCPLFETYGLDFVFAGHNHYYERNYPMNQLKEFDNSLLYNFSNPIYPMYITTGGAGAPLSTRDGGNPSYIPPEFTAYYNSTYHFVIIEITNDDKNEFTKLSYQTWAMPETGGTYGDLCLIDNVTITKRGASLKINSPLDNQLFGKKAPNFNISIKKEKLCPSWYKVNTTWYTLGDNTEINIFKGEIGTINQTKWNDLHNGTLQIKFWANDSLNFKIFNEITVLKDMNAPKIIITNPKNNSYYNIKPKIQITVTDPNFDTVWYGDGNSNYSLSNGIEQEIADEIWFGLSTLEIFHIYIYANDSAGNLNNTYILELFKDTEIPEIVINLPENNTYFNSIPLINVTFYDTSHEQTWFLISGNSTKIFLTDFNHTEINLNNYLWEHLLEGLFLIKFFANDSAGNINDTYTLYFNKDTQPPDINIISPNENETFGISAPVFTLNINEGSIKKIWYTMDNGIHNYTFNGKNGTLIMSLNQSIWNNLEEGKINVTFYIIDYFNKTDFVNITLIKRIDLINVLLIESDDNEIRYGKKDEIIVFIIILSLLGALWMFNIILILCKKGCIRSFKFKLKKKR